MFKKLLIVLLIVTALPMLVYGQSVGKIAGVAKDKSTGEPLPGVNIVLEGTSTGSATDIDGYYVILNVPVGIYTLRASYIGYNDYVVENVRVSAAITTEINLELQPTTLELEEAVVVTAERPLVEKNVTQSISLVTAEQLDAIPVRGVQDIIALQNSVVVQDGNVHIRGGRAEETGYYLDGADTRNPLDNTASIAVVQEAVEELQVLAGGYTAEFGSANAGIIRAELKTGGKEFHTTLNLQTDKFTSPGKKFLDTYSYQHHIGVLTIGGPLFSNKVRYFLAGQNQYLGDDMVRFSRGYRFENVVDTSPDSPTLGDSLTIEYPDGFTPQNRDNRWDFNGTLLFDFSPVRLRLSGSYGKQRDQLSGSFRQEVPWLSTFNQRTQYDETKSGLFTAKLSHVLSPTMLYDVSVSYWTFNQERGDDWFDDEWTKYFDSTAVAQYTIQNLGDTVAYRDRWRENENHILLGMPFRRQGDPSDFYRKRNQNYIGGAINFLNQMGRHHEVKVGFDIKKYKLRQFSIRPSVMIFTADTAYANARGDYPTTYGTASAHGANAIQNVPVDIWMRNGIVDAYGYDLYGNKIDNDLVYKNPDGTDTGVYVDKPKQPLYYSIYAHDKIEYNDLIINFGLRYDYFDSDDQTLKDPKDPKVNAASNLVEKSEWVDVNPFKFVSPRLGFSFPVSERTVFYLQYGKFVQMPSLNQIYFSSNRMSRQIQGGSYFINPIGFGLEPIKTTSYEIGFRQQISSVAAFDITGFYRNVKGQVQVALEQVVSGADVQSYERFINGDFATTKGIELRLTLRRTHRLAGQINYTITQAEGTASTNTSYHSAVNRVSQLPTVINPLDYENTHRGSINLDYRFGRHDGGPLLQMAAANILFNFNSGHPYTFVTAPPGGQVDPYVAGVDYMFDTRSREALEQINASTTPWNFLIDLRLDKGFPLFNALTATLYARVTNLLNTRNVINVYQKTGVADDDGYLSDPAVSGDNVERLGQQYVELYRAMNIENGGSYRDQLGLELWGHPRQIWFGIRLDY